MAVLLTMVDDQGLRVKNPYPSSPAAILVDTTLKKIKINKYLLYMQLTVRSIGIDTVL